MDMENAIKVEHLSKSYPGFALRDLTFSIPRGCIVGLIGENGAGKTTTRMPLPATAAGSACPRARSCGTFPGE